jgi:protein-disulfide isomerase
MKRTITFWIGFILMIPVLGNAEGITKEQAETIIKELKQIRLLMQNQQGVQKPVIKQRSKPQFQNVTLPLAQSFTLGNQDAPVTLVEFTDYQCSFCNKFHKQTFPELKSKYIDTGKVKFISRDFPNIRHKLAFLAARGSRCAGEQGKYWEFRHLLSSARSIQENSFVRFAESLSLSSNTFMECLNSDKFTNEINKDIRDANSIGVTGTPSFVLGTSLDKGDELKGIRITGAKPFKIFERKIQSLLAKKTSNH